MVSREPVRYVRDLCTPLTEEPQAGPLILVGYLPDGRPYFRPLRISQRPVAPTGAPTLARPAVQRRAVPAGWVAFGVTMGVGLLAGLAWLVVLVVGAIGAAAGWMAGNAAVLIGAGVLLLALLGLAARPGISIVQKVTIR